jgi:hypothetical protein
MRSLVVGCLRPEQSPGFLVECKVLTFEYGDASEQGIEPCDEALDTRPDERFDFAIETPVEKA